MSQAELNDSIDNSYNFLDESAFIAGEDFYFGDLLSKIDNDMKKCIRNLKNMGTLSEDDHLDDIE